MSELDRLVAQLDSSDYELTEEDRRKASEKWDCESLPQLRAIHARVKTTKLENNTNPRNFIIHRHQLEWLIKKKEDEEEERKRGSSAWLATARDNQRDWSGAQARALSTQDDGLDNEAPSGRKGSLPLQPSLGRLESLKDQPRRRQSEFTPNARMANLRASGGSEARQAGQRASQSGRSQGDTQKITWPKLRSDAAGNKKPAGVGFGTRFSRFAATGGGSGSSREGTPATGTRTSTRQAAKKEEDAGPIDISSDEEGVAMVGGREPDGQAPQDDRRRSTRSNQHRTTSQKYEGLRGLFPPDGGLEAVQVTPGDLARLDPDEFLNDTVIDFMAKFIQVELAKQDGGEELRQKFYYFNSFFYKKLTEKTGGEEGMSTPETNHDRVRKWTKGVDIFAKEFLFIPIHDHLHWSLLIVCHPASCVLDDGRTACIIHCDSMPSGGHTVAGLCRNVRSYLALEWKRKMGEQDTVAHAWRLQIPDAPLPKFTEGNMPHKKPAHVPKQENYCDCGLFLLTYIDFFSFDPPAVVDPKRLQDLEVEHSYPLFLSRKWFSPDNAGNLRRHMRWLILSLFIEQAPAAMHDSDAYMRALEEKVALEDDPKKYRGPAAQLAANEKMKTQLMLDRARKAEREAAEKEAARALAAEKKAERNARRSGEGGKREGSAEERRIKMADAAERRRTGEVSSSQDDFQVCLDSEEPVEDNLAAPLEDDQEAHRKATFQTRSGRKLKRIFQEADGGGGEKKDDDPDFSQAAVPEEMRERFRIHKIIDSDDDESNPLMVIVTLLGEKDARGRAEEIHKKELSSMSEAQGYMKAQWEELGFGRDRQHSDDDCRVLDDAPKKKKAKKQVKPRREAVRQSPAEDKDAAKPKAKQRGRGKFSEGLLANMDRVFCKKGRAEEAEEISDSNDEMVARSIDSDASKANSKALRGDAAPSSSDDEDFRSPAAGPSGRIAHREQQQSGSVTDLFIGRASSPMLTNGGAAAVGSPRSPASKLHGAMTSAAKGFINNIKSAASQLGVNLGHSGAQDFEGALSDTAGDLQGAKSRADAVMAPAKKCDSHKQSPPPEAAAAAEAALGTSSDEGRGDSPILSKEDADKVCQAGAAGPSPHSLAEDTNAIGSMESSRKRAASGAGVSPPPDAQAEGRLSGKQYFGSLGAIQQETLKRYEASRSGAQTTVREDVDNHSHEPQIWEEDQAMPSSPPAPNGKKACSLPDSDSDSEERVQPEVGPSVGSIPGVSKKDMKRRARKSGHDWGLNSSDWTSDGDEGMDNLATRVQEVSKQPTQQPTTWAGAKVLKKLVAQHGGKGSPRKWPAKQKKAKPKAQYAERKEELRTTPSGSPDLADIGRVHDSVSASVALVGHQRNDGLDLPCAHLQKVHRRPHPPGSPGHVSGLSEDLQALDLSKPRGDTVASTPPGRQMHSDAARSNLGSRSRDQQPNAASPHPIALSEDDSDDQLAKPRANGFASPAIGSESAAVGKSVPIVGNGRASGLSNGAVGASGGSDIITYSRKRARREGAVKLASPDSKQRHEASAHRAGGDADGNSSPMLMADLEQRTRQWQQEAADREYARKLQEEYQSQAEVQAHVGPRFSSRGAQMISDGDDSDSSRKDPVFRLPIQPAKLMPPQSPSSSKRRIRKKNAQPPQLEGNQLTISGCYQ